MIIVAGNAKKIIIGRPFGDARSGDSCPRENRRPAEDLAEEYRSPADVRPQPVEHKTRPAGEGWGCDRGEKKKERALETRIEKLTRQK